MAAYRDRHDLRLKEKFSPKPGTDIDPAGIPNPMGYMDPYTLNAARELICRNGSKPAFDGVKSGVLRNLTTTVVASKEEMERALNS